MQFNHAEWPYSPDAGYRGGTNYRTISLFIERCREGDESPYYSLSEADVCVEGKWYPSARLIYINSKGEYDAYRKLVGSYKQWTVLKELAWFREFWEAWHAEWKMLQAEKAREKLVAFSKTEVSAARALFDDAKKNATAGRPKKSRARRDDADAEESDMARVVAIRPR